MVKVELKIGHRTFQISERDLVLDNGSCAQVVSQEIFKGWGTYAPVMSKKMFNDMKKLGFLYTNDELKDRCHKNHADFCTYYAFDIPAMIQAGYIPIPEKDEAKK